MSYYIKVAALSGAVLFCSIFRLSAQSANVKTALFEGIMVAGYVDKGLYINCTGPAIKISKKPFAVMAGLLPSLKIKDDKSAVSKNATVTPTLGFGATVLFKHLVVQLPFFYNAKTGTKDGNWTAGIGVGYKFY